MGHTRKYMMEQYPEIINQIQYDKKNGIMGQTSLLSLFSKTEASKKEDEFLKSELLAYEKDVLGVYLSGHPLDEYYNAWITTIDAKSSDFIFTENGCRVKDGKKATIGGIVTSISRKITKNKKMMAILVLEDMLGAVEVIVFPEQYEKFGTKLSEGEKYYLQGTVKQEDEKDGKLILEKVSLLSESLQSVSIKELWIQFINYVEYQTNIQKIMDILNAYPGTTTVYLYLKTEKKVKKLDYRIDFSNKQCMEYLTTVCGTENIYTK